MTEQAAAWSEHDLDHRFERGEPHDELTQLAWTLDHMLDPDRRQPPSRAALLGRALARASHPSRTGGRRGRPGAETRAGRRRVPSDAPARAPERTPARADRGNPGGRGTTQGVRTGRRRRASPGRHLAVDGTGTAGGGGRLRSVGHRARHRSRIPANRDGKRGSRSRRAARPSAPGGRLAVIVAERERGFEHLRWLL